MTHEKLILTLQELGVLEADWETDTICHLSPVNNSMYSDCFMEYCTLYFDEEGNVIKYKH